MLEIGPVAVDPDLARFVALVRRELGARDVEVLEVPVPGEAGEVAGAGEAQAGAGERELRCTMPDGRLVLAHFDEPVADRDAKQRRLEMLAGTFDGVGEEGHALRNRPSPARSLHDELVTLCERARAVNALVVDANSPILWAAARPRDIVSDGWNAAYQVGEGAPPATAEPEGEAASVARLSREGLRAVRDGVDLGALRRGKRVRHVERGGDAPVLAHSFAGIYLLTLVFAEAFDELRAERAVLESLPRVERLVMALPPLDPSPQRGAGVIALRRRRR